ncbi:MAG: autotransporter domain-containing protein, partial [Akkermansia sp.]|nr:autotransporter domain-containing protein [Akkermansia sp.]
MTLDGTSTTSSITMISGADGSGTLNILGDVETGALTLNSGTINVGAIDEEGNNVVSHLTAAVTMTDGIINVGTGSTISSLTVNGATLSDVSGCTVTMDTGVEVEGGEVTVDEGELSGTVSDSKLTTQADSLVSADVTDSEIIAEGGEISGTISGTSSVVATSGTTTISGENNDYSGGTVINGATLKLEAGATVGTGAIELTSTDTDCGVFDMGGNDLTNKLIVTGCILRNAQNYQGDMEVSHELEIEGVATAKKVTLIGEGTLVRDADLGGSMTTDEVDVQTDGNAGLDIDLTINDNGTVTLNNGKVLSVMGSLTLGEGVSLRLSDDDYGVGDTLLSSTGTLTMGDVTLVYNDSTVELELQGNSLVLVSKFKQDKADAVAQGNWGIASASRAFVNTVRGQHSNTGCIANGRGTVWAAAFGAYNDMDGADINVKGAAVGVDTKVGSCSTVGLAVGYADGEVSPTGLRDVDQEGTYVALYGEHGL